MKIDEKAIRKLAELLDETDLTEIEVAEGEQSIRISRGQNIVAGSAPAVAPQPAAAIASDPTIPQQANTEAQSATISQDHPGAVTSPMVGTAYLQPEPDSPSFAEKGSVVKEGDTLLIIEAMKVMNPIKAHRGGTITQILIQNAQPVEFGDVLFVIE
jgi:acetyl-CoA carboxylase biotin carboxyl carrier protein